MPRVGRGALGADSLGPGRLAGALVALMLFSVSCTSGSGGSGREEPASPALADVAEEAGLEFRHGAFRWEVTPDIPAMMGSGVCWLDYDGDGWIDLFVVNSYAQREAGRWQEEGGLPRSALFRNMQGEFVDVSSGSGADLAIRGSGCVAADFDLDGNTDLYVTSDRAGALLWNEGDGTFTEGAAEAGAPAFGWYAGAAVGDVNGDGWPDLFLAGYADLNNPVPEATRGFPNTYLGVRDLLYLSEGPAEGRVGFREVGIDAGLEVVNFEYGLGALFSDLDRDGDLDLYVANDTNPNRLYENVPWPGGVEADPAGLGFRFEELGARAGVADPNSGMGVAAGDFDGDRLVDLFVTNARGQLHAAFRSRASGEVGPSFADVRLTLGPSLAGSTGWGASLGDLDLDTDLDLVYVNGDVPVTDLAADAEPVRALGNLAAQGEPGRFEDLSRALGLGAVGPFVARGSAEADYDNDGDLDLAVNSVGGTLALLENTGGSGNWLEVQLGRFDPGALVTAVLPDGSEVSREAYAGSSYLSSEDVRLHFGLGTATEVTRLVIRWTDGEETEIFDVDVDQVLTVEPPT